MIVAVVVFVLVGIVAVVLLFSFPMWHLQLLRHLGAPIRTSEKNENMKVFFFGETTNSSLIVDFGLNIRRSRHFTSSPRLFTYTVIRMDNQFVHTLTTKWAELTLMITVNR